MDGQVIGSAKKNLSYHNTLILHESKKQTVKDQLDALPSPFVKMRCEGVYTAIFTNSKGCPRKTGNIYIYFKDL